jgi:serine/threonine protein kinase
MKMLAEALLILYNNKLVHGDLKPDNILLNDIYEPVVCDLGSMVELVKKKEVSSSLNGSV